MELLILFILIIIFFLMFSTNRKYIENAAFALDGLYIPDNPVLINEADDRRYIRIIGIEKNLKFDKYDRIEKITYKKPKPEQGETKCYKIQCPNWLEEVICLKCN